MNVHGLLYHQGDIVFDRHWGLRDRIDSLPADAVSFPHSMTKPIITAAVILLYEEGKYQLDVIMDTRRRTGLAGNSIVQERPP